jgi:hypothetical protein
VSVHFATAEDQPVPVLELPATIDNGSEPALFVMDGFVRGLGIVGRFGASPGLIGIKVATGGLRDPDSSARRSGADSGPRPLRITLTLRADGETAQWWEHRVKESVRPRLPHGPRVVLVRSQGATRGAALFARRPGAFSFLSTSTVSFDLAPEEVPDDGLLIIELADPPERLTDQMAPSPAVGIRLDSIEIAEATGEPPAAPTCTGGADLVLVTPRRPVTGTLRWRLRARPSEVVSPDPIPPQHTGIPWEQPPTGTGRLRYRDKAVALARRRVSQVRFAALRRARRGVLRGGQALSAPVRYAAAPARGLLRGSPAGWLVPLDGSAAQPCTVTRHGSGVEVTWSGHLSGPALLSMPGYRLVSTAYRPPEQVSVTLTDNATRNREALQDLLDAGPVTVLLPAGRYPLARGLALETGRALHGSTEDAGTVLVQDKAEEDPLLHLLGSGAEVADVTLELPAADPGQHDGDRWTALTVGRYFYPTTPDWISGVTVRGLRVRRDGRCAANSVAILGAVRDITITDLDVTGGGTGLAVHWGAVGRSVSDLTGPSYHPHRLTVSRLAVREAFEGFYLSSVHDAVVSDVRGEGVEIGFRLLPGDNTDRFHTGSGRVSSRITVSGCDIGWCGPYAMRLAGWGRSEIDGAVTTLAYRDVTIADCTLRVEPQLPDARPRPDRRAVVIEQAAGIELRDITEIPRAEHAEIPSTEREEGSS